MKVLILLAVCVAATLACQDRYTNCRQLTSYCRSNSVIRSGCQKTCGLCSVVTTPPAPANCVDTHGSCRSWTRYCAHNSYVRKHCKRTCNLCSGTGITTQRPVSTQRPVTTQKPATSAPSGSCGRPKFAQSRVVGGKTANANSWPWQIGLHRNGGFMCGGSVINNRWIVTAAHCVHRRNAHEFSVKLGDHDRYRAEGEQTIRVEKIITHAGYGKLNNDIALLKLAQPVKFNDKIQPVCLPAQGEAPSVGSKCYITGWGKMRHPGNSVQFLQQLALTIQDKSSCSRKNSKYTRITDQMLCAANTDVSANESGCHGDSGGPFVCKNSNGSWTLHGAVSWGSPQCNIKDAYTVFARVGQFRNWIEQQMAANNQN